MAFKAKEIAKYLEKYSDKIEELFNWDIDIPTEKLISDGILCFDMESSYKNEQLHYKKQIILKKSLSRLLKTSYDNNKEEFNRLCLWIVQTWGKINSGSNEKLLKIIHTFMEDQTKITFDRISSSSKVYSFFAPDKYIIYDSRVAFALNWIINKLEAGVMFFPVPKGQNSKMSAFDISVIIRINNINHYENIGLKTNLMYRHDMGLFFSKNSSYSELNSLVTEVNRILFPNQAKDIYLTEMVLYAIADNEIINDIVRTFSKELSV